MALLAEGKRKTKYGLDPQNTQWSKDTNKFGQRLMEKMGWEKGKGLGANENGMTEHVKASYKWDQSGLGAGPQNPDAWVAHQDDFNDLLKMLNSGKEDEKPEDKDKASQAKDGQKRYYGRFSRGRVQTLRTTEDLDCIFGRRKSASAPTTPSNQSVANSDDEGNGEGGTTDKSHGLTTVTSTTSVHDYFAKKMREIKARQAKSTEMEEVSDDVQKHNESKTGLKMKAAVYGMVGFSYCDTENEKNSDNDNSGDFRNKSEGRSSRGWYQSWDLNQNEGEIALNGDKHSSMKPKAKKKKKDKKAKRNDVDEGETVVCIAAEESVESATLCDKGVEQKESSKKKKKLKNKHDTSLNLDADSHNETKVMLDAKSIGSGGVLELNNKGSSVSVDQKFERNKNEEGDSVNLVAENAVQCEDTDSFSKKKKKKRKAYEELEDHLKQETKKRKTSCEVTEMANKDLLIGLDEGNLKENKTKKKKRRKGKDLPDSGNCDGSIGSDIKENSQHGNSEEKPSEISSAEKKKWKRLKKDASNDFKNENSKLANDTVVIPSPNPAATVNGTRNNKNTSHEAQKSPSNLFKPRGTQGKKKKKLSKQKKSIFPGSNLEDLNGYAVVKTDSEEKVKKIKKSSKIKKRGFICARDVDDKLRKIAKVHGSMVGKSESVRS